VSTLAVILIVLGAILLLLFVGGAVVVRRRNLHRAKHLAERIARADQELASAYAVDKGWERGALDAAARKAFATEHPGEDLGAVALVGVVDLPGTDEDRAVFEVITHGHSRRLTLRRTGDEWLLAS
jgi:hypothetical protein